MQKKSLIIKDAQTKLGVYKELKNSKGLSTPDKIANMITMFKTKWRKVKRKNLSSTLGGTIDYFANQFKNLEIHESKRSGNKY